MQLTGQPATQKRALLSTALIALSFTLYASGNLPLASAVALPFFALLVALHTSFRPTCNRLSTLLAASFWLVALITGFAIALYRPGNFSYPAVHHFSELGFTLYPNFAKALAGYFIIIWLWGPYGLGHDKGRVPAALLIGGGILAVLCAARFVFDIAWQPKLPAGIFWFVLINVGITVVAEEAFFRLLLQDGLAKLALTAGAKNQRAVRWGAAAVATLVFALAHAPITHPLFWLFLLAGGVYALVYQYTGRFSAAIATHFGVNILHFTLLEYPLTL